MTKQSFAIGIDLGGTKLEAALVDESGKTIERLRIPTKVDEGPDAIMNDMVAAIEEFWKKKNRSILGVGIGIAGQINPLNGDVHFAPNLKWHEVPLQSTLHKLTKLPIIVINDVRAAAWGEWLHGAGKGSHDLICLFIGTGVGGGIVSGGHMLTGVANSAGELGHMTIDLNGPLCTCGNRGCLEAFAGGWAIARNAKEAVKSNPQSGKTILSLAGELKNISGKTVIEAALKKDPLGIKLMEDVESAMIAGCTGIVNALNPERLILGGGIAHAYPPLIKAIEKGVNQFALKTARNSLKILTSELKGEAGVVGAAALVFHQNKIA